jgi:hypothetical protein
MGVRCTNLGRGSCERFASQLHHGDKTIRELVPAMSLSKPGSRQGIRGGLVGNGTLENGKGSERSFIC